jgi:hypothetical protein
MKKCRIYSVKNVNQSMKIININVEMKCGNQSMAAASAESSHQLMKWRKYQYRRNCVAKYRNGEEMSKNEANVSERKKKEAAENERSSKKLSAKAKKKAKKKSAAKKSGRRRKPRKKA